MRGEVEFEEEEEEEEFSPPPPLSPRSLYAKKKEQSEQVVMQLVTHLNAKQFRKVREAFGERATLPEFVSLIREILPSYVSTLPDSVRNLVELFREIDGKGDDEMEFEDFSRYLVEKARVFDEQTSLDRIPHYKHKPMDTPTHRNLIDRIVVLPDLELLAVAEQHSAAIQLYRCRTGEWYASFRTTAVPLAVTYVQPQQALLVACSDVTCSYFSISWDLANRKHRFRERHRWPTPDTLMCMCWADSQRRVYSGNTAGIVHAWEPPPPSDTSAFSLRGHDDIVMDVLHIKTLDDLVSASLDTTVRVWDTYTEQQSILLRGHTKGVNALAYSPEHRFLVSAGFDHDAFVWSPFVSTLLFRMKGHRAALVGCHAVEGTHEVITGDSQGLLKLWDLRNFQCVQTFTTRREGPGDLDDMTGVQALTHVRLPKGEDNLDDFRIVAATKRLFFFDQFRAKRESATDAVPLRHVFVNDVSLTIFVASDRTVKIWDAIKGTLERTFLDVVAASSEITAACLDFRKRKFFVGDGKGRAASHNYANGALIKTFPPHAAAVAALAAVGPPRAAVAAYADGAIRVYADQRDADICCLRHFDEAYNHADLRLLAVRGRAVATAGDATEGVRLWDLQSTKCTGVLQTPAVLALGFCDRDDLLYLCTADGYVRFWRRQSCLLAFPNRPPNGARYEFAAEPTSATRPVLRPPTTNAAGDDDDDDLPEGVSRKPTAAIAAAFDGSTLALGDELGNLRCFDLAALLDLVAKDDDDDDDDDNDDDDAGDPAPPRVLKPVQRADRAEPCYEELLEEDSPPDDVRGARYMGLAAFAWSVEYAHDEAILAVSATSDPGAVITSGLDRCVRMWGKRLGDYRGMLLHGVLPGAPNPFWDLDLDVANRERLEREEALRVERCLDAARLDERLTKKTSDDQRFSRESYLSSSSSSSSSLLPTVAQAERHERVVSALINVKSMTAEADTTADHHYEAQRRSLPRTETQPVSSSSERLPHLSVVPAFPTLDRLSPDAQRSLDKLAAALRRYDC
ncbi:hypothetical protein CTAYLR_006915 [Chrysophaeum taylorii]|uniref:EF-hand domain-containing protein n=1 Tax=Chrysophaeum taylorii TaxID=2483200 RepID=A0AAD7U986_9STRA|nr:hypothetical protein CTAYLR_006915 [Chrysophaeum taylorii]